MYGCFDPVFVYGIEEPGVNMMIDQELLEEQEIEYFTDHVVKGYACNIIYGVVLSFDDFITKKTIDTVIAFAKKFNLPETAHYLAISGDFELCHEPYSPC